MDQFLAFPLEQIPYVVIALMIAFTIHEFAHAYVAYKFGDPTAKNEGRVSLNPLVHLDPIGTLLIFIVGFGWAKPVPVNRFYFRNPKLAGPLVSVAGPLSNICLAFLFMVIWFLFTAVAGGTSEWLHSFFVININLNLILAVFNLLPLPPLDGYRIIQDLVPNTTRAKLNQYEHYSILIFLVLVITPLGDFIFLPLFHTVVPFLFDVMSSILMPLWG
ncbi:site-2 protease family protein [Hazenella sp. IB182353]|uniref:site-2 protease family protein n=1 Tax=Polycladospora coralii TaxID=2771432 RepID=UPI001747C35D|nr:site-2 protease family protein [Polycladospora coralii]MBS7531117.1 site-2 protease family protein [Polycladospora coralii]